MKRTIFAFLIGLVIAGAGTALAIDSTLDHGRNRVLCPPGDRAGAVYVDVPGGNARDGVDVLCMTPTATPAHANCHNRTPWGALPPAVEEWCTLPQMAGIDTAFYTTYGIWVDDWQHGQSHAGLGSAYNDVYHNGSVGPCEVIHFRHSQHWMSDLQVRNGPANCAAWLRPILPSALDENGRLIIETEVANPVAGTRNVGGLQDSWPEVVISTAVGPGGSGARLYESFGNAWTFGCAFPQNRHPVCALHNGAEVWEIGSGRDVRFEEGGDSTSSRAHDAAWLQCTSTQEPDVMCRNQFRIELYKDGTGNHVLDLYVRHCIAPCHPLGPTYSDWMLYYRAGLLDNQLDNIFNAVFYTYFGSFAQGIGGGAFDGRTLRFHWDRIAVNP